MPEDDIAALTHQGVHGGAHLGIVLGNLVYNEQLLVHIHAQGLHSLGDAGVDKQLFSAQSEFQRIDVLESKEFGKILVADGDLMLTEKR